MAILATFFSLLLLLLLLFKGQLPDGKTPWQWRTEKHQNCTPKLPNVTSETHRKWWEFKWSISNPMAARLMDYTRCAAVAAAAVAGLLFPGALPLASAGVGGYIYKYIHINKYIYIHIYIYRPVRTVYVTCVYTVCLYSILYIYIYIYVFW